MFIEKQIYYWTHLIEWNLLTQKSSIFIIILWPNSNFLSHLLFSSNSLSLLLKSKTKILKKINF
jgi:hypothetical protein